jgi:hypothetical protein
VKSAGMPVFPEFPRIFVICQNGVCNFPQAGMRGVFPRLQTNAITFIAIYPTRQQEMYKALKLATTP